MGIMTRTLPTWKRCDALLVNLLNGDSLRDRDGTGVGVRVPQTGRPAVLTDGPYMRHPMLAQTNSFRLLRHGRGD